MHACTPPFPSSAAFFRHPDHHECACSSSVVAHTRARQYQRKTANARERAAVRRCMHAWTAVAPCRPRMLRTNSRPPLHFPLLKGHGRVLQQRTQIAAAQCRLHSAPRGCPRPCGTLALLCCFCCVAVLAVLWQTLLVRDARTGLLLCVCVCVCVCAYALCVCVCRVCV